jgi:hypothetical protein
VQALAGRGAVERRAHGGAEEVVRRPSSCGAVAPVVAAGLGLVFRWLGLLFVGRRSHTGVRARGEEVAGDLGAVARWGGRRRGKRRR